MIRILITDKLAKEGVDLLKSTPGVEPVVKTGISEDELASIIGEYDGLIIRSETKVTAKVLEKPGKLRAIARAGVGVDNVDCAVATRKGILVMNTPGGNTLSAAEHTMALMLALSRKVPQANSSMKAGAWDKKKFMGNQLNNKTLGVIGMGRIGMAVIKMASGFGMKILGYDPLAAPAEAEKYNVEITDDINRIFKESDYITLHVPKNEKTVNMIDAPQLAMMKPTVRIINVARGGIINEDALYDVLKAGKIAGAALDVFAKEPTDNKRYMEIDNCIVTPHLGASTEEAQIEVAREAAEIIVEALKGGAIRNAINAPASGGTLPAIITSYAELARKIGLLMSAVTEGSVKNVEVQYRGTIAEMNVVAITTAFSIGLLQKHFDIPINMVNVGVMAKERGISIDITKNSESKDVASSFTAKVVTSRLTRTITGTVFGDKFQKIMEIDGFSIEVTPTGTMMVIFNDDKPGVIGAVGTICGKYGINISTMGVGQKRELGKAVLAVSLDAQPNEKALAEFKKLDFVNELYVCSLD